MKVKLTLGLLFAFACGSHAMAQTGNYFFPESTTTVVSDSDEADSQDTLVEAPQAATVGSVKGNKLPSGGDYGTGQPLCSPQISLSPKSTCTKGSHWWCDPCGFGSWGCGTPVRTALRNTHKQLTSLLPCGPWCQSAGCNCSGQGPYAMDWSQPDRRSCACDCKGSHYLFPWIWNYNPSRGGCCINRWTQRGDGYRSALQFNQQASASEEEIEPTPAPPSVLDAPKTTSRTVRNASHQTAKRKPASAIVQEAIPVGEEGDAMVSSEPIKPAPTGAMSANYLTRLVPRTTASDDTQVAAPLKAQSSRRR
jgi:hypothetical protein